MISLADLNHDTWTIVAVQIPRDGENAWQWDTSDYDRGVLLLAREQGRVTTTQQRNPMTGRFRLLAKLVRQAPAVVWANGRKLSVAARSGA